MPGSTVNECRSFNLCTTVENGIGATQEHIGRGDIAEGFMVAVVVVMVDEGGHGPFQVPWKVVMLKADEVFEGTMVALNLALGHGMEGFAPDMANIEVR